MTLNTSPTLPIRKLLVAADAVLVASALGAAFVERAYIARHLDLRDLPVIRFYLPEYALLALLALPSWLALAWKLELYTVLERAWTAPAVLWRLLQHHVLGFVAISTLLYATQVVVNRSLVVLFIANSFVALFAARWALVTWRRVQYRRGLGRQRLLLVGYPEGAMAAFVQRAVGTDFPPQVLGYLSPNDGDASLRSDDANPSPRLGSPGDIAQVLHEHPTDRVLFFPPCDRADQIETALLTCESMGIPALLWVDMGTPTDATAQLTTMLEHPFVSFELSPKRVELLALKHALDFLVAAVGVVLLSPLLLLVSLAILLTNGRPVLFGQERAGLRGRPFRMLKFRTMVQNADTLKEALLAHNEMDGPVFKIEDDPRITRLGRILRNTSIDELPQLFHVLSGRMSLVGPRPLPLSEQTKIGGWHRRRLAMRPGISGLWQVSGRNNVGFERWMQYDLQYVDDWSLWLDVKILARTVAVVLLQRGAR